jgi:hypothetical protein
MLLLPATFDHLGGVGPLNHRFLYGSHPDNPPSTLIIPIATTLPTPNYPRHWPCCSCRTPSCC